MKYTIEQIKEQRIAVICSNKEEGYKLAERLDKEYYEKYWKPMDFKRSNNFSIFHNTNSLNWNQECNSLNYFTKKGHASKYINFNDVDFEESIPKYFAVKNDGSLEFKEYIKWLNKTYNGNWVGNSINYYYGCDNKYTNSGTVYHKYISNFKNNPVVFESAKEFMELLNKDIKETFVLPEYWCVKVTKENEEALDSWRKEQFGCKNLVKLYGYLVSDDWWDGSHCSYTIGLPKLGKYKEITFEQFEKYVLKENNMKEEKEIIGYKLIKPEYKKAAEKIMDTNFPSNNSLLVSVVSCINNLKKAGVLDLWFEPVYKTKEKIVSVGGKFDVTIKDGKVFHKNDDITEFVKNVVKIQIDYTFGGYSAHINDIIFYKTGCENTETKLSDWKQVYEELNAK